jgi:hypothetical protein
MENNLDQYFVTFKIFKGDVQIHEMTCPKSLIHHMSMKWKFPEIPQAGIPGSEYDFHIIDHTDNFRMNSKILNDFFN